MHRRLTTEPVQVPTRKQVRAAHMAKLRDAAFLEAKKVSQKNQVSNLTAWVYLNIPKGAKASFMVTLSHLPRVSLDFPTSTLKLVAGFQKGLQVI